MLTRFLNLLLPTGSILLCTVMRASPIEPHGNSHALSLASFVPSPSRSSPSPSTSASSPSTSVEPSISPNLLAAQTEIKNWALGADSDIGGLSWCKLEPYEANAQGEVEAGARFYGKLSSQIKPGMKLGGNTVDRSGYAGIRTKVGLHFRSNSG